VPDDGEKLSEAARIGRPMIHAINNDLGQVMGTLDLLTVDPALPEGQQVELELAVERLGSAATRLRELQRLVRSLGGQTTTEG
jgi:hypothetical protein